MKASMTFSALMEAAKGLDDIDVERRTENGRRVPSKAWRRYMAAYHRWLASLPHPSGGLRG